MGRFWNYESGIVLVVCLAVGIGGCFGLGLDAPKAVALGLVAALLAFFPIATWVGDKLIEIYGGRGNVDRALFLAISFRDHAPNTRMRNTAYVDVALLHLLRRDYERAHENLAKVKVSLLGSEAARAVVDGHTAYCLAHLNRELERAEELARSAVKLLPKEPLFAYFLGLTLLQRGQAAEAEALIAQSLQDNADVAEPYAGERPWALARARAQQGKDVEPARSQAIAAGGHFAEAAKEIGAGASSGTGGA